MPAPTVLAARHNRTGGGINRVQEEGPRAQSCRRAKASVLRPHALPSNVPHITGEDWKPCKPPIAASNSACRNSTDRWLQEWIHGRGP
jgi:hypothetical protein